MLIIAQGNIPGDNPGESTVSLADHQGAAFIDVLGYLLSGNASLVSCLHK